MTVLMMIKRNVKLFFKDKGLFFTSLITPLILLVLYATFLSNVYRDSFLVAFPKGLPIDEGLIDGLVGGQLMSSILAVSSVTVAFCSNMLMVQDKANGVFRDLTVTPAKPHVFALSYYVSTLISTLLISFIALTLCLLYVSSMGWYLSLADVLSLALDVFLLVMFGTALSSVINFFLSTQGQISAVGSIVSSCYGFICGAYMPISQFSPALQKALSFLPGTYGTSLVRNHSMRGVFLEMEKSGVPSEVITALRDTVDCNVYFSGEAVKIPTMYLTLAGSVIILIVFYLILNKFKRKAK